MEDFIYHGAAEDPRSPEEKALDYPHDEFLGGAPIIEWKEKPESEWVKIGRREQISSSSCGGQAGAKAASFFYNDILSAIIYRSRKNYPAEGMYIQDIGDILKNKGTDLETLYPSQNMTGAQMNAMPLLPDFKDKVEAYYFLPSANQVDMDLLAQASLKGHPIIILTQFKNSEWTTLSP